jgi:hypothetical protein
MDHQKYISSISDGFRNKLDGTIRFDHLVLIVSKIKGVKRDP